MITAQLTNHEHTRYLPTATTLLSTSAQAGGQDR